MKFLVVLYFFITSVLSQIVCGPDGGQISIVGSSTVEPIAKSWAAGYKLICPNVIISVAGGNSSVGAGRVCNSTQPPADIGNMSREWTIGNEVNVTDDANGKYICNFGTKTRTITQVDVAIDGIAVTLINAGLAAQCLRKLPGQGLSIDQLRWIYSSFTDAEKVVSGWNAASIPFSDNNETSHKWNEIGGTNCPNAEIKLSSPGELSGTYEFFKSIVLPNATEGIATNRPYPPFLSYIDEEIYDFIETSSLEVYGDAIGYFGFAFFINEGAIFYGVPIQNKGASVYVRPTTTTVGDGTYVPFTSRIYMNVWDGSLVNTKPYIEYGLNDAGIQRVRAVGYIPPPSIELPGLAARVGAQIFPPTRQPTRQPTRRPTRRPSRSPVIRPPGQQDTLDVYPGDDFSLVLNNASPGSTVIVHQGTYTEFEVVTLFVGGTVDSPIVVRNEIGESRPQIRFAINIAGSSYFTIQGLEILSTMGNGINILSSVIRENKNITLDDLVIHDVDIGINTISKVDGLRVRKTRIYDTESEGFGCSSGSCILLNSTIEYNWIYDTKSAGILINKNSFGNIVRHNVVYNVVTRFFPDNSNGIQVYGSGNGTVNIIEGNVIWNCTEGGISVAADAIVQNNLVFSSGYGFQSYTQNGVTPKNLKVVHNTFLNNQICLYIDTWDNRSDIIFANNAFYCDTDTFYIFGGTQGVQISGNVFYPIASSFPQTSFFPGRGIKFDFVNSAASFNAYPINVSPLLEKANASFAIDIDFDGTSRVKQSPTVGAYEYTLTGRRWNVMEGFKPFQNDSTTNAPVSIPVAPIVPPIANPAPNAPVAPVASPSKAPLPPPTVVNPTTKAPTKAPISATMTPIVPVASSPQAPLPKTKPPQVGPITPGNIIDIYPGEDFVGKLKDAAAGDTIIFHQGNYTSTSRIIISVGGTPSLPVIIRNAIGESRPRIQNTINIEGSTYLTVQGLEIVSTGGDGVRITNVGRDTYDITLEDLIIHNVSVGINAKTKLDMLHVNRTHIYDTSNAGEGIALGCEDGSCIVTNSIIEYNWIHDTATQGEGIEINKNSFGNIVRHNVVYNNQLHGILMYGSGSGALNTIEGNVMWNCTQAGIKVAADAIVQNNLVFTSGVGLESLEHNEVSPRNLRIVHNTILNNNVCLTMQSWNGKSDIIFANNAAYCNADTFKLEGGYADVQLAGNVFSPRAESFPTSSFTVGRFLTQDFKDFTSFNAYPTDQSTLRGKADQKYSVGIDFDGTLRTKQSLTVGAYEYISDDARKWVVTEGFKPFLVPDYGPTGSTPVPTSAPIQSQEPPVTPTPNQCRLLRGCIFGRTICFSGHNTVQILKRRNNSSSHDVTTYNDRTDSEIIMMSDLKVGDYVRSSSSGQYTRVISFCHKDSNAVASFIQIHSKLLSNNKSCKDYSSPKYKIDWWNNTNRKGEDQQANEIYGDNAIYADVDDDHCDTAESLPVLELSHDHMVYVLRHQHHHHHRNPTELTQRSEKGWVRAADVVIGDVLIHRLHDSDEVYYGVVTDVTTIQRNDGVYSPITTTGSLYVSNTMVSSYVAVVQTSTVMSSTLSDNNTSSSMLLFPPNIQHMIAQITLTPIRLLCQYDFEKYCQNEVYDNNDNGYAWYSRYILYYVEWLESLGTIRSPDILPQFMFDSMIRIFQWTITIVIMIPFLLLYLIECSLSSLLIIMNGYYNTYHHHNDDSNNNNVGWSDLITNRLFPDILLLLIMTIFIMFTHGSVMFINKSRNNNKV